MGIQRYSLGMIGDRDGNYVLYTDHAAEVARLEGELKALDRRDRDLMMEASRRHAFENAPETMGPCVHCGLGMAAHEQSRVQPLLFWCPSLRQQLDSALARERGLREALKELESVVCEIVVNADLVGINGVSLLDIFNDKMADTYTRLVNARDKAGRLLYHPDALSAPAPGEGSNRQAAGDGSAEHGGYNAAVVAAHKRLDEAGWFKPGTSTPPPLTVGDVLVREGVAKDADEADKLCMAGKVCIDDGGYAFPLLATELVRNIGATELRVGTRVIKIGGG